MITKKGGWSWYGGPRDSGDNNRPALAGATNKEPGIAVYNRSTLGGYWLVDENGRQIVLRQTDIGPLPPRVVDINYTALKLWGYTERNFPTDKRVSIKYLGKSQKFAQQYAQKVGASFQASPSGTQTTPDHPSSLASVGTQAKGLQGLSSIGIPNSTSILSSLANAVPPTSSVGPNLDMLTQYSSGQTIAAKKPKKPRAFTWGAPLT